MINLTNRTVKATFIADNIVDYNDKPGNFSAKKLKEEIESQLGLVEDPDITDSEIGVFLADKLATILNNPTSKMH